MHALFLQASRFNCCFLYLLPPWARCVQVGIPVVVLESAAALRGEGAAIGVWTNGWKALDALGAADQLRRDHPRLER
jgi:hypothetical protein